MTKYIIHWEYFQCLVKVKDKMTDQSIQAS